MTSGAESTEPFELPLFPLHAVLFPGGILPLRIFEPRYLTMISRCVRDNAPFGVCLIHQGTDTGAASAAAVGTVARVVDWQPRADGMLGITARGENRFRVKHRWTQPDGLNRARVASLPADLPAALPRGWKPRLALLRQSGATGSRHEAKYGDASWVGYRFAELLPLPLAQKQVLLEMSDPLERLRMLSPLVEAARRS